MNKIREIDTICKKYKIENYIIDKDGSINVYGDVDLSEKRLKIIPLKFNIVNGYYNLCYNNLISLKNSPVYVKGYFNCSSNKLTSLKYSPREINSSFLCEDNKLKSLKYGPEKIGYSYVCGDNLLISIKGIPEIIYGDFECDDNELKSLEYGPKCVYGYYDCSGNKLKNLKGCAKYIKYELDISDNRDIYSFEWLTYNVKNILCKNTLLYNVWRLFNDINKIELFNDMDIIREDDNGKPVIILDRLNEFLDMIGKPRVKHVEGYINI